MAWWFVFKFNAASYPACAGAARRSCPFGGEIQDYRGQFSQQYVFASSVNSSLRNGSECLGNSEEDPLGATFGQIYHGNYYYVIWNDQLYNDPRIPGCRANCSSPWGGSKGMLAWNDAGDGLVLQVSTPSWPASGNAALPRKSGNTLGCMKINNLQNSQHFFSVRLSREDVVKVLRAMANASVATDLSNKQLVRNGGPAEIQSLVERLGMKSDSTEFTYDTLSSGVRLISKPSNLHVPPWQMISAILGGVPLRVATWWARPRIYSTSWSMNVNCWERSLGKPGPVEIATSGFWAGYDMRLVGGAGTNFNHAKIGVSTDAQRNYAIFGDLNQQGGLSERCSSSQNGRGGLFYVVDDRKLAVGLRNLLNGDTAAATGSFDATGQAQSGALGVKYNSASVQLTFDGVPSDALLTSSTVRLNGKEFGVERSSGPDTKSVTLLGRANGPKRGFNIIQTATQTLTYWYEGTVLRTFEAPYPSSYAIIAAIDDYTRQRDPLHRGPTRYPALEGMVANAEALRKTLLTLGFPQDHIRTFYDERATTQNLQDALKDFYQGGPYADASRVFFYFGGHGDGEKEAGYLVTYDFDPNRPTATGFPMSSFVSAHFPFVKANHMIVAIDSCSAGLAIPGAVTLGGDAKPRDFATLAQIKEAVEHRARDIIVAGTGAEPAVANAGGIFTQELIDGLSGKADLLKDGLVQFDELSLYVKRNVTARARALGAEQVPSAFKARGFGRGEVIFLLPQQ